MDTSAPRKWLLLPVGWLTAEVLFVLLAGGDWMGTTRYLAPVLPAFTLLAAEGWRFPGRAWPTALGWAGLATVLVLHGSLGWVTRDVIPTYTREGRELGRWLGKTAAPGDTVAVTAAGAIPYFSGLPTLDVLGINDPRVRKRAPRHTGSWAPGHHRYDLEGLLAAKPAWIVWDFGVQVNRHRLRQLADLAGAREDLDYRRALLADPRFAALYAIDASAPAATQGAYTVFRRR